ncbi:dTDP-4-dehydrorhamnose 3,5-epimerase family protein [Reichenbachiella carrageenanivorans]|uniref:dTDP-4-dehydrorhamnose 3,5-epimerase n=1 Tax=Reichenbachiella carrageenanivorans TaxID=2979869 RepID=A0ABY6D2M8_9BACT|nr:dTDP-4-dehydrorhamnose 3,5-epimerase family protein [Reichenbachiella carrageenanivorans]UXX80406.1 dTDP-4-dehydrorhamnose 3,5-epimerase family protein [Reichenbachiella carrageenanivorans]
MSSCSKLIAGKLIYEVSEVCIDEKTDSRGSFSEVFQNHWDSCLDPVQWSVVKSVPGVFRGMHLHKRHDEYFSLLSGHCLVGLMDLRPGSPTEGVYSLYELYGADMKALIFPKGLLHGWYFFEDSMHIQAVSESYVDYGKDDNWGCRWDAPDLEIPWPMDSVHMSSRAEGFPTVSELKSMLQDWEPFKDQKDPILQG